MPKYSLQQIFIAIIAVAIGLSIWRLPSGSWFDIPLAVLSFYFVLSLLHHAAFARQVLMKHPDLPRLQLWGARFRVVGLYCAALMLIVSLMLDFLVAADFFPVESEFDFLDYVGYSSLPHDLTVLVILEAMVLGTSQNSPAKASIPRQKIYLAIVAGITLIGIIAYWADRLLIWYLVYLAVSGVEMAQSAWLLPPELNISSAVRLHGFTVGSFAGLLFVITSLLLIGSLVKWWHKPCCRWILMICLAGSVAAECWIARWIAVWGLWQLSPSLHEALKAAPLAVYVVVGVMILFAVGAFCWRLLAKVDANGFLQVPERPLFFYQSWLAGLLFAMLAMIHMAPTVIDYYIELKSGAPLTTAIDWTVLVEGLIWRPTQLIWLAAILCGLAIAWKSWRRRELLVTDAIPCVDPALYALTMLSLTIVVVARAVPILAAASFSCWTVLFDKKLLGSFF